MRLNQVVFGVLVLASALVGCSGTDGRTTGEVESALTGAAKSGALDPTFGSGGKVATTTVEVNGLLSAALQADGKIVVATSLADFNVASIVFGVLRYRADGTLDSTFGAGGVVRSAPTIGFNYAHAVGVAPDGKLVVVGSASTPSNTTEAFALARYLSSGALDATFGHGGIVTTTLLGFRDDANVVLFQPDGKILVGGLALPCFGRRCAERTAIVRYDASGGLDTSFGSGGAVVVDAIGNVDAMALERDGTILVTNGGTRTARFTASGAAAPVALAGGVASSSQVRNVVFQPDGRVVVGDSAKGLGKHGRDAHVDRYALDGALDPSFQNASFVYTPARFINTSTSADAVLVQSNGAIVAGGTAPEPTSTNNWASAFGLARFTSDGHPDATFGTGGTTTVTFSGEDNALGALVAQRDGKLVAVGLTSYTNGSGNLAYGVALARFLP